MTTTRRASAEPPNRSSRRAPIAPATRPAQLVLVRESTNPWRLSPRARTVGREGVAQARDALADARPRLRRAG